MKQRVLVSLLMMLLSSCSFAPKYQRPEMPIPADYKETGKWVRANPKVADLDCGPWWELYQDTTLNALEQQLTAANQNLQLAYFRYLEAKSLVKVARSAYFPSLIGVGNAGRQGSSRHVANPQSAHVYNDNLLGLDFSYEIDVWGAVRNAVAASRDAAKASAADLAAVDLSLHAELAEDYFTLRGYQAALRVLDTTVVAYKKALSLTQQRHSGGAAPESDVDQAETQYENAKTMATDMRLKIAELEHAIAVLIGEVPANFTMKAVVQPMKTVMITPLLPSTLLERRPDIAETEWQVEAANARIGVARAAFFPAFNLISVIGFESRVLSNLISKPSLFWALGSTSALTLVQPAASVVLFDGGRLRGLLDQANAQYYQTVAQYRQTVLTAFQEVEDSLAAIHRLDQERVTQRAATAAAERAYKQSQYQYKGGIVTFLEVVVTENTALQAELASIEVHTRRQVASVQLIKALGGGWHSCVINCLD